MKLLPPAIMKEYKSVMWPAMHEKVLGKVDTEGFDQYLNSMAAVGWELQFTECLNEWHGTRAVLCIFVKESTSPPTLPPI